MYLFDLLHTMINLLFDITNIIISNSSFPIIPANFLHYVLKTIISVSSISDFLITTYIMTTKPKCSYHDYNDYDNVTVSIKKYKKNRSCVCACVNSFDLFEYIRACVSVLEKENVLLLTYTTDLGFFARLFHLDDFTVTITLFLTIPSSVATIVDQAAYHSLLALLTGIQHLTFTFGFLFTLSAQDFTSFYFFAADLITFAWYRRG